MSILGLHHVQVLAPAGGEAEARRFYGQALGLREIAKPPGLRRDGAWFALPDGRQLHVGVFRDGDEPTRNRSHFALQVKSVDELAPRLKSAGLACAAADPGEAPGWRRLRVRDPFGNSVELLEIAPSPGPQGS